MFDQQVQKFSFEKKFSWALNFMGPATAKSIQIL
jgi:hypothetical protein